MAKKNEGAVSVAELHGKIEELQAENAALVLENGDLREHNERLMKDNLRYEERFDEEHKKRMHERNETAKLIEGLKGRIKRLEAQVFAAKEHRAVEQYRRHGSIPKFVIVSAVAMVLLTVPFTLQSLAVIGPQLGFGIEAALMMVISFCYAIIWDRSKK